MVDIGKPEISLALSLIYYIHILIYIHTHVSIHSSPRGSGSLLGEKASYIQDLKPDPVQPTFHSANDRMVVSQRNELRQKIVGRLRTWAFWGWSRGILVSTTLVYSASHDNGDTRTLDVSFIVVCFVSTPSEALCSATVNYQLA